MPDHFFEPLARHAGAAYLRYSFTKGTEQEVGYLVEILGLRAGDRVLDVGCGPGRHALALAARGIEVVGLDISDRFVEVATEAARAAAREPEAGHGAGVGAAGGARFVRGDARRLPFASGTFDAVITLCQGGFGLVPGEDGAVIAEIAAVLKPGGRLAASAFSSYFVVRFLEEGDTFDPAAGVNHEMATVRDEQGVEADFDLWTSCFTPRELRLIAAAAGLEVEHLWSVTPGAYGPNPPDLDHPEWLLVARTPPAANPHPNSLQ